MDYTVYRLTQSIVDTFFPDTHFDFMCSDWRGSFFKHLEADFEIRNCKKVFGVGRKLSEVIKEGLDWKSGDLKNGRNSIGISDWEILDSDLDLILTKEWVGLKIYKKGSEKAIIQ